MESSDILTVFYFWRPRASLPRNPDDWVAMLTGKLVHVIDDDSGFLKGIERLLRAHGFEVRTFPSAEAFEASADPTEALCLIVDVHLGGMTGIELLNRLSAAGTAVPVVLVTANSSEATRKAAAAAGCSAYLEKPVPAALLISAVRQAVTASRLVPRG